MSMSALLLGISWGMTSGALAAPVATIVEGDSVVVRGASRLAVAEGMRFMSDDLVETTAQSRLLRIEFDDGLMVLVAPGTRLWLNPKIRPDRAEVGVGGARAALFYLLTGTVKLTARQGATEIAAPVATPLVDIQGAGHDMLISISGNKVAVFAESGDVRLTERNRGKNGATLVGIGLQLRSGEYYTRAGTDKSATASRPDPDLIRRLPRAFLDSLPPRASVFAGRNVVPKPLGEFGYADAQPWVDAEAALRPAFVARWRPLAVQPVFRQSLAADMRAHPEWDRILHPEKYLPKPKPRLNYPITAASGAGPLH